jgi:transglutaminase-like putative cysteine protease
VSGYLETLPPPGKPRLIGADASHAWVSIWCGEGHGWFDLDPTNNCMPTERHITVAYGRDFSDVSPLRGVVSGSGDQQMSVAVDVMPKKPTSSAPAVQTQGQSQSQSQSQSQGN